MIKHGTTSHFLNVTKVAPHKGASAHAVQLLDTQVKVEFEEAEIVETKDDTPPVVLQFGEMVTATVGQGNYVYYRVKLLNASKGLKLTLTASSGDPDLYVSTQTKPTWESHTWSSHGTERKGPDKTRTLEIAPSDPAFLVGWFYVAVHGYNGEASFSICADEAEIASRTVNSGRVEGPMPDAKQCENCKAMIPAKSLVMHQVSCSRNNWWCPICETVLRKAMQAQHVHCEICKQALHKDDLIKHMDVVHRRIACPCGAELAPGSLGTHQATECNLRMIECKHCSMKVQLKDQQSHEQYCGSKSTTCELCGQQVARRWMDRHNATEHNVNPSLRPQDFGKKAEKLAQAEPARATLAEDWGTDIAAALKASATEADQEDWAMRQAVMASLGEDEWNPQTGDLGKARAADRPAVLSGREHETKAIDEEETLIHYGSGCVVSYPDLPKSSRNPKSESMEQESFDEIAEHALEDDGFDDGEFERADCECPYCHTPFARFEMLERHLGTCEKIE